MGTCARAPGGWCERLDCVRDGCVRKADGFASFATTGTTATDVLHMEEALRDMRRVIDEAKINDQWVVIDPHGRLYKGKVEELLPAMLPHHPLLAK